MYIHMHLLHTYVCLYSMHSTEQQQRECKIPNQKNQKKTNQQKKPIKKAKNSSTTKRSSTKGQHSNKRMQKVLRKIILTTHIHTQFFLRQIGKKSINQRRHSAKSKACAVSRSAIVLRPQTHMHKNFPCQTVAQKICSTRHC